MKTSKSNLRRTMFQNWLVTSIFGALIAVCICAVFITQVRAQAGLVDQVNELQYIKTEEILKRQNLTDQLVDNEVELVAILTRVEKGKYRGYLAWQDSSDSAIHFVLMPMGWLCDYFKIEWACSLRNE